jgi:poly(beta-D-mannuronate) lyase
VKNSLVALIFLEIFIMRQVGIFILVLFLLASCASTGAIIEKNTGMRLEDFKVTRPGVVIVDHTARQRFLSNNPDLRHRFCHSYIACYSSIIPPIPVVKASSEYGLDHNFEWLVMALFKMTDACLAGDQCICKEIVNSARIWADADAAKFSLGDRKSNFYWNQTLTVNLLLVRSFTAAYSIARSLASPSPETDEAVINWLMRRVKRAEHTEYNSRALGVTYQAQNHCLASSSAMMMMGSLTGDNKLFQRGIAQWFITLGSMRNDGSLPLETWRGARALMYSSFTLQGLMSIAETAYTQGYDLYSMSPSKDKTVHHAVKFILDAYENHDVILKYARLNFVPGPSKEWKEQDLHHINIQSAWIELYMTRFPKHENSLRIKSLIVDPRTCDVKFGKKPKRCSTSPPELLSLFDERMVSFWICGNATCLYREEWPKGKD